MFEDVKYEIWVPTVHTYIHTYVTVHMEKWYICNADCV